MKLYSLPDGPPSIAVRMALKALDIPYELVNVDYLKGEHMTDDYAKMNPQKEVPVLDDDGFFLSESAAIIQYLADKYRPESKLYPKDLQKRSIINQRMFFNSNFYYTPILMYTLAPLYFDYPRTESGKNRMMISLSTFEAYLKQMGTSYATGNDLTIADFSLMASTLCLEAVGWDFSDFPLAYKWYESFKKNHPEIWKEAQVGLDINKSLVANPPDMSKFDHPFYPKKKN